MSRLPSGEPTERDRSEDDLQRKCGRAAAVHKPTDSRDVATGIESQAKRRDAIDPQSFELIEAPLKDNVRNRTLEPRPNRHLGG